MLRICFLGTDSIKRSTSSTLSQRFHFYNVNMSSYKDTRKVFEMFSWNSVALASEIQENHWEIYNETVQVCIS